MVWVPLALVGAVVALFAVFAWRFPVLFRMGVRNMGRRKSQSAVVIAGLMVGTAIIAGSFATADSLSYGIQRGAYDALGPVDETVNVPGALFFPQDAYDALAENETLRGRVHGMAPYFFDVGALKNPEARLSEPGISVVGFDPEAEKQLEPFVLQDGRATTGTELRENEVLLAESLAMKLNAGVGTTLTLSYSILPAPLLPVLHNFSGTLAGASGCTPPLPLPNTPVVPCPDVPSSEADAATGRATFTFPVDRNAMRVVAVALPDFQNRTSQAPPPDFDLRITSPDGLTWENRNGTPAESDRFAMLNATTGERLEEGNWTFEVSSKAAASEPFNALVVVLYETYDLNAFRNVTAQFGNLPDGAQERLTGGGSGGFGDTQVLRANLTVRGIVKAEGKGDFLLRPSVFLRLEDAQRLYDREGRINAIGVSNTGDPENGVARSAEVRAELERALTALAAENPDEPSYASLEVTEAKKDWLEGASQAGERFKQFLTTIGAFTIIAGVMLIVNIFVMLAEERKSELGMARAVGLKRRQLLLLFSFEGLLYAIAAAFVGVLLGLAISGGLLWAFNNILADLGDDGPRIAQFAFRPNVDSLAWAFASGFLLTIFTVAFASYRVSKLNVVRAIRRLEEPQAPARWGFTLAGAALALLSFALTAYGFLVDAYGLKVFMPPIGLIGLGMFLSRWVPRRFVYPLTGAAVAAYVGWTLFGVTQAQDTLSQVLGILRGVVLVLAVVLIVVYIPQFPQLMKRGLRRVRALAPIAAPSVMYPMDKKTRTGLTVSMFALVILVVVVFSIFGATFNVNWRDQAGGFDIEADTTAPITDLEGYYANNVTDKQGRNPFDAIARYESLISARGQGQDLVTIDGKEVNSVGGPGNWFYAYDRSFADTAQYEFEALDPAYETPQEALHAVLNDSSLVVLSSAYNYDEAGNPGAFGPGSEMVMNTSAGNVSFRIIGVMKQNWLGGYWVHPDVIHANFQRIRGEYLFAVKPGEDPAQVAKELEAAFESAGMEAVSIQEEAERFMAINRQFLTLFQLFLAFGLVVGIASMGIITARNVIERRQEIGMLRAVGFRRSGILRIFLAEILFTTLLGMLIGVAVGVFIAWAVYDTSMREFGLPFNIPYGELALILGLTALVTILATYWPARRASLIPPAEAVRYIE